MAEPLKFYPDVPSKRTATILRDLVLVGLIALFAWIGFRVHDAVAVLAVLGTGVREAGDSVQQGFDSASGAVDGIPIVGDTLAGALQGGGSGHRGAGIRRTATALNARGTPAP